MSAIQWNPHHQGTPATVVHNVGGTATVVRLSDWRRDHRTENTAVEVGQDTVNSISGLFRNPNATLVSVGQPTSMSALLLSASRQEQVATAPSIVNAELRAA